MAVDRFFNGARLRWVLVIYNLGAVGRLSGIVVRGCRLHRASGAQKMSSECAGHGLEDARRMGSLRCPGPRAAIQR